MSFKTGATIIKRILFLLVLIALLLPLGISAQSNQTSGNKPMPTPDNTVLINLLKGQLRNAENAYQNAFNYLQSLSTNPYVTYNTIFQAQNNALYWLNKVTEYKTKLIDLGCYDPSVPVVNFNNNYGTLPQNTPTKNTSHWEKVTCSFCHGTGKSPSKEYPPNYGLGTTYDDTKCEICGSFEVHYHKSCPSCSGKGYNEKYVP